MIQHRNFVEVAPYPVACRNCGRLIRDDGRCGCSEERRRRSTVSGWCVVIGAALLAGLIAWGLL